MSRLKSVLLLLTLGVISVLAVLAQDSPTPTGTTTPIAYARNSWWNPGAVKGTASSQRVTSLVDVTGQINGSGTATPPAINCIPPTPITPTPTPIFIPSVTPSFTPSRTPSPTPSPTPLPEVCEITSVLQPVKVRTEPSLYYGNWLLEVPNTYKYNENTVIPSSVLPNRPWLWPNMSVPSSLTISSIRAIASVGNIGWVDPDIDWLQVEVITTNSGSLKGYMPRTDTSGNQVLLLYSCSTLPIPSPDLGVPSSTLSQFTNFLPESNVFNGNQSPAVMGSCGQHIGSQNPCSPNPNGSTIDIVPRNHELCIDTETPWQIGYCDANNNGIVHPNLNPSPLRIPIYAPKGGCATFDTMQVIIRLFRSDGSGDQSECNTPIQNGDLLIVLTHITASPIQSAPNRQPIQPNTLVGYLCLNENNEAYNACGVYAPTIPTHLAFQLQTFNGSYQQAPADVIGYLARQGCLYDKWKYVQGNPSIQDLPITACP